MTWLPAVIPGPTPLDRVFGLCPEAWERFRELQARLWDPAVIDPRLLDLCRLRVGMLVGGAAERPSCVSEAQAADVARWPTSAHFTERERACLSFAERYVLDPHGITDDDFAALRAELAPAAIAMLTLGIAVFDALARFQAALGVAPAAA